MGVLEGCFVYFVGICVVFVYFGVIFVDLEALSLIVVLFLLIGGTC